MDQQVCHELEATGSFGYMDLDVDEVESIPCLRVTSKEQRLAVTSICGHVHAYSNLCRVCNDSQHPRSVMSCMPGKQQQSIQVCARRLATYVMRQGQEADMRARRLSTAWSCRWRS